MCIGGESLREILRERELKRGSLRGSYHEYTFTFTSHPFGKGGMEDQCPGELFFTFWSQLISFKVLG